MTVPLLDYGRIAIGEIYADREIVATAEQVAGYGHAVRAAAGLPERDDDGMSFLLPASWAIPRVSFTDWRVPGGGIHARQSWRNRLPVRIGDRLRLRTTAIGKYERNGRRYVEFAADLRRADGQSVGDGVLTIAWPA
ncbi:MaoC family dehydratase [Oceanibacterium hippocampi]|uniref:N-terminal of MaoC-like dehydratase domain-containing protein n=1 Tax=Oceanibacterium hippocampi TaxID=745714 RepID=A0A1Y5TME8_9PROT|nr:MaoC family dehydratase [Oceanibacterium hippocampi]SLN65359.1 hypothetical protein OCH7691_02989 [Oceanibacterium hippocampi]